MAWLPAGVELPPWAPWVGGLAVLQLLWGWWLAGRLRRLERRLHGLAGGIPEAAAAGDPAVRARLQRVELQLERCQDRLAAVIGRVGLVRFDAFPDAGGRQSYALALLNERGDGVVLTSLFGREQAWTYAKPVRAGSSPYPLSPEERTAIARALAAGDGTATDGTHAHEEHDGQG